MKSVILKYKYSKLARNEWNKPKIKGREVSHNKSNEVYFFPLKPEAFSLSHLSNLTYSQKSKQKRRHLIKLKSEMSHGPSGMVTMCQTRSKNKMKNKTKIQTSSGV